MIDIQQIWRAGRVRRWHMNPDLADTMDPNDGHCARVARLLMALWPDTSGTVLRAALTHDDEELFIGDMGRPAKDAEPEAYARFEGIGRDAVANMWNGSVAMITAEQHRRLKFCDRLDAYLWMMQHKPDLRNRLDWHKALQQLQEEAGILGVFSQLPFELRG